MEDRLPDQTWMEVLAEMRRRYAEGADTFIVRTSSGRPQVYTADERSSHTARIDS
jgi:hypothetical protein